METAKRLEQAEAWRAVGAEGTQIERLLALARIAHREELTLQRDQIRERVLERLERNRIRRRRGRFLIAGASAVLLGVLLATLVRRRLA
jgi:hypothetical protein